MLAACSKLRRTGFTPIALGGRTGPSVAAWFDFLDMRANGYEFHQQLLDGKVSYNDGNVRRTFSMWRQLIDAKCFDANATAVDERGAAALLYAGRAGMMLTGTVVSASFPEIVRPQIDYEKFPQIDASQAAAEAAPTDTFHIAAHARNKADARRFLKFAGSNAVDGRLAKAMGSFPTNKYSPVAGSVLDLSSYKVLTDAKANLVQGYDRDVPAEMAVQGVKAFQEFLAKPDNMYPLLVRLDAVRETAYANAAALEAAATSHGRHASSN
jgi:multiple sugar transport system substrate-binding protein